MKKPRKEEIQLGLLFEKRLSKYLEKLGKYEDFSNKKIKCERCQETVTIDNLNYLVFKDGEIRFFCSKPNCMKESS